MLVGWGCQLQALTLIFYLEFEEEKDNLQEVLSRVCECWCSQVSHRERSSLLQGKLLDFANWNILRSIHPNNVIFSLHLPFESLQKYVFGPLGPLVTTM